MNLVSYSRKHGVQIWEVTKRCDRLGIPVEGPTQVFSAEELALLDDSFETDPPSLDSPDATSVTSAEAPPVGTWGDAAGAPSVELEAEAVVDGGAVTGSETVVDGGAVTGSETVVDGGVVGGSGTVVDGGSGFHRVNLPPPLAERFVLERVLSSGGAQADVLLVRDGEGGLLVVKLYRTQQAEGPDSGLVGFLLRDDVEHLAHVVRVFEVDQFEGLWWEVQEFVAPGSLLEWMDAGGPVPGSGAVGVFFDQMCDALVHAHGAGLVHRDIKPGNVLLRSVEPLSVVLADFGLATVLGDGASREQRSGSRTPAYGAPEAAWGQVSPARDWWSLGMVVLELLTGAHPFRRPDGAWMEDQWIGQQLSTRPVDVSAVDDPRWRVLCEGLLVRDPALRWGAGEVAAWRDGETPEVHRDTDGRVGPSAVRRTRPYAFAGELYTAAEELGAAMAANWAAAGALVAGRELDELSHWLRASDPSAEVVSALDGCAKLGWSPDRKVAELVVALAPGLAPSFRGRSVAGSDLLVLARAAAGAEGPDRVVVDALFDSRALRAFAALDGFGDLARHEGRWTLCVEWVEQTKNELVAAARADKAPGASELFDGVDLVAARAAILAALLDDKALDALSGDRPGLADARDQPWFLGLEQIRPAQDLQPAWVWLRAAMIPIAVEMTLTTRARQLAKEKEEQERQRREAERQAEEARLAREQAEASDRMTRERERRARILEARQIESSRKSSDVVAAAGLIGLGVTFVVPWLLGYFVWRPIFRPEIETVPALEGLGSALAVPYWLGGIALLLGGIGMFLLRPPFQGRSVSVALGASALVGSALIGMVLATSTADDRAAEAVADYEAAGPTEFLPGSVCESFSWSNDGGKDLTVIVGPSGQRDVTGGSCRGNQLTGYKGREQRWSHATAFGATVSVSAVYGETLVLGFENEYDQVTALQAVDARTGDTVWSKACPADDLDAAGYWFEGARDGSEGTGGIGPPFTGSAQEWVSLDCEYYGNYGGSSVAYFMAGETGELLQESAF